MRLVRLLALVLFLLPVFGPLVAFSAGGLPGLVVCGVSLGLGWAILRRSHPSRSGPHASERL